MLLARLELELRKGCIGLTCSSLLFQTAVVVILAVNQVVLNRKKGGRDIIDAKEIAKVVGMGVVRLLQCQ